jgi:hypothetical protein
MDGKDVGILKFPAATIYSSHGEIGIDENGNILAAELYCHHDKMGCDHCNFCKDFAVGSGVFNVQEYINVYGQLDDSIDILDIGFTDLNGNYEPPCEDWREDIKNNLLEDNPDMVVMR